MAQDHPHDGHGAVGARPSTTSPRLRAIQAIDRAIEGILKQIEGFEEITTSASISGKTSATILKCVEIMREHDDRQARSPVRRAVEAEGAYRRRVASEQRPPNFPSSAKASRIKNIKRKRGL